MCVDKDILYKNNTIYSPEKCCIVPETINMLFTNRKRFRGDLPIGVCHVNKSGKYMAKYKQNGKDVYIGTYKSAELAFESYKMKKEEQIKSVALKYKDLIPNNVYNALINYNIDIND